MLRFGGDLVKFFEEIRWYLKLDFDKDRNHKKDNNMSELLLSNTTARTTST